MTTGIYSTPTNGRECSHYTFMQIIGVIGFRQDLTKWIKINMQAIPVTFRYGLPERAESTRKRFYFIEPTRHNVDQLRGLEFTAVVDLTLWDTDGQSPDPYFMEVLNSRVRLPIDADTTESD